MIRPLISAIIINLCFCICVNSQITETFKKIDAKHGFKDIVFGTSYNLLKNKLGLKKSGKEISPSQYIITNKKYLSIGDYNADFGTAYFSKNKLWAIVLAINLDNGKSLEEILNYLTTILGVPDRRLDNSYEWKGSKLLYSLSYSSGTNDANILIKSLIIKSDRGENNF